MENIMDTNNNIAIQRAKNLMLQRQEIVKMTGEQALDTILEASQPVALVHSFPEEDFYFLINHIGHHDSLPLLSMASNKQLEHILDIEIWEKDMINMDGIHYWLTLFFKADQIQMTKWLMDQQTKLTEYYLYKNIEVRIREHDEDPSDMGDDFFTIDNIFYIRIIDNKTGSANPREHHEVLERFINQIANIDHICYQNILLESSQIISAEFEEQAYTLRNVRLAEKGFLPFEEAIGVYQPLEIQEFKKQPGKYYSKNEDTILPVPLYISESMKQENLFVKALKLINTQNIIYRLELEFAGLCNKIAVADQKVIREKKELNHIIKKAGAYISIGLEKLADNKQNKTKQYCWLIEKYSLSDIFRVGYGLAMKLKFEAEKWKKQSWFVKQRIPITFWGEDWLGVLGGLLIKKPLFFDNYKTGALYAEFSSLDQINSSKQVLKSIIAFDSLLEKIDIHPYKTDTEQRFLTCKSFILTLWTRDYLGLGEGFSPITTIELIAFFKQLFIKQTKPRKISPGMKQVFLSWLSRKAQIPDHEISDQLGQTLENLFNEIEAEYGQVEDKYIDPRYVNLFVLK